MAVVNCKVVMMLVACTSCSLVVALMVDPVFDPVCDPLFDSLSDLLFNPLFDPLLCSPPTACHCFNELFNPAKAAHTALALAVMPSQSFTATSCWSTIQLPPTAQTLSNCK